MVSGGGSVSVSCCEGADLDEVVSEDAVSAPGSRPDALRGVLTADPLGRQLDKPALAKREAKLIRDTGANNPAIGYNIWPR